jgi:hypothetical protein
MAKSGQKRPRDNPEDLTQNVKQIKLNDYWLNQPFPSNTNRFDVSQKKEMMKKGQKTNNNFQSTTHICGRSPKHLTIQRTISNCDGRQLRVQSPQWQPSQNPT